jgi:nucleoid-associated protein YgaU
MPSSTRRQHDFMEAIANNSKFARKVGVPQSVGKDFEKADRSKKFSSGGQNSAELQVVNKKKTNHGATALFKGGGMATKKMAMGGKAEKRMMPAKMEKINDTMSAKKPAPKEAAIGSPKMGKVKNMSFAKGGGIESKGKTKGKVC